MENIPEDRYICKWCWYCTCNQESTGEHLCNSDIGDIVNVNGDACPEFEYDPDFVRY